MTQPQQHQHGSPIITEAEDVLLRFRDNWYKLAAGTQLSGRSMHWFDVIILYLDGKPTYSRNKSETMSAEELVKKVRFILFAEGKTFDDLPCFKEDAKYSNGPLNLYRDANGDLVAMSAIQDYDATN